MKAEFVAWFQSLPPAERAEIWWECEASTAAEVRDQSANRLLELQRLYEAFVGSGHNPKNPREAAQAIGQMHDAEEEIGRFHKLLLDRTGAMQLEPVDIIMGRWLDQLAELEKHHREHHNCTACAPCIAHRGLL